VFTDGPFWLLAFGCNIEHPGVLQGSTMALFGKKDDNAPVVAVAGAAGGGSSHDDGGNSPYSSGQLESEIARLSALSIPQLATEIMTKAFTSAYQPGDSVYEADAMVDLFCRPSRPAKYHDVVLTAQLELRDLIAEGLQALDHAGLVRLEGRYAGEFYTAGYVTTRRGRSAVASNAVDQALASS
jgi:hypothetical protein